MNKTEPALKTVVCDVRTFYERSVMERRSYHDHEIIIRSLYVTPESALKNLHYADVNFPIICSADG